jgi:hypothetical protein
MSIRVGAGTCMGRIFSIGHSTIADVVLDLWLR